MLSAEPPLLDGNSVDHPSPSMSAHSELWLQSYPLCHEEEHWTNKINVTCCAPATGLRPPLWEPLVQQILLRVETEEKEAGPSPVWLVCWCEGPWVLGWWWGFGSVLDWPPTSFSTVTPIAYIKTYSFVETQHWNTDTSPTALTHWTWFRPKQLRKNKHFFDYMTAILLRDVAACGEVILLKMGYIKETTRTGNC